MKRLKKLLVFLSTGTMAVVLAACYGVPVDEMYNSLIRAKDDGGNPIKGLKVSIVNPGTDSLSNYTNENGIAYFGLFENEIVEKIVIEDVDGSDNGGEFIKTEVPFEKTDTIDVTLELRVE
jgi:hypothetical protein